MKKVSIISAIFGSVDPTLDLLKIQNEYPDSFEFHLYTNNKRIQSSVWSVHYVDELIFPESLAKTSYYYKWNHHKLKEVSNSDITVWLDSSGYDLNQSNLKRLCEDFSNSSSNFLIERHPSRSGSLKAELEANCSLNKDNIEVMRKQVESYYKDGYRDDLGIILPETGFTLRKQYDKDVIALGEKIIQEMIGTDKTKRDQLIYNYAVYKINFPKEKITHISFEDKITNYIKFKDHYNTKPRVCLVGPWIGDDALEEAWVDYVKEYLSTNIFDEIIVGCKKGNELKYKDISPDRYLESSAGTGIVYNNLVDGKVPHFEINSSGTKDVVQLNPATWIFHRNDKIKYSFLMPFHFRSREFRITLETFTKHYSKRNDYEVIVVEDIQTQNSPDHDELIKVIQDYKHLNIIHLKSSLENCRNPSAYFNDAARYANGGILILTNPECAHSTNILNGLDGIGNDLYNLYTVCACGVGPDPSTVIGWYQHTQHRNDQLHFLSVISKTQYFRIGGFDENYTAGIAYEDDDFRENIKLHKIPINVRDDLVCIHIIHNTEYQRDNMNLVEINKLYYNQKWNVGGTI